MRLRRRRHPLWLQYSYSIYISSIYTDTTLYYMSSLSFAAYLQFVYEFLLFAFCLWNFLRGIANVQRRFLYIYIYIYSCTCCIFVFLAICFSFFLLFFRENRNCTGAFAGLVSLSIVRCRSLILRSLSPSLYRRGFVCGGGREACMFHNLQKFARIYRDLNASQTAQTAGAIS